MIGVTNNKGELLNQYQYDPFGNIINKVETQVNEFLFTGQWGVRALPKLVGVYGMRKRIYFAKYGRFGSLDPYGFGGQYTNLYCYVGNNPVTGINCSCFIINISFKMNKSEHEGGG